MKLVALPEVAKIIMGQSPPSSSYNTQGEGLPFFQGKADFGDLHPTVRVFCTEPKKIADAGDILISVRAPVGLTNISPERSCIGRGLAAIRGTKDIDTKYLLYFLRFSEPELAEEGKGSTFSAVSRSDLERVQIPLPPLPEQKRIAAILAKADRLRRLRRTARDLSDTYLQSVFLEMFGDPVSNPMGWEVMVLSDLKTKFSYGTSTKCYTEPKGLPVLRIPNVLGREINLEDLKYAELPEKEVDKISLLQGDLLFVRTNGNPDYVGRCAVFGLNAQYLYASYLIRARLDLTTVNPWFLATYLRTGSGRKAMSPYIRTTAGQSNIGIGGLGQIPVPLPPFSPQQQFARIVHKFERLRAQQREAERQAEHIFQTLLHRAFRGELR
ncbi:MAG: restriction endonuclease subunit S [Chloroflexota bacterium]|nr:restriction endonuclease subunit S [Chloroflexota bacterium]